MEPLALIQPALTSRPPGKGCLEHTQYYPSGNSCRLNCSASVTVKGNYCCKVLSLKHTVLQAGSCPSVRPQSAQDAPSRFSPGAHPKTSYKPTHPLSQSGSSKEILRQTLLRAGHGQPRLLLERLWPISLLGVTLTMPLAL